MCVVVVAVGGQRRLSGPELADCSERWMIGGTGLSLKPQITMGDNCRANIPADTPEIWPQDPSVCIFLRSLPEYCEPSRKHSSYLHYLQQQKETTETKEIIADDL